MPEGIGVRLIDIPARSWEFNLFETLHEYGSGHAFAEALQAGAREHHGHVLPAFVQKIVAQHRRVEETLAVLRERDALRESNRRLEHLIAELNQVVHGKRSEKLNDDERQLAFEDLKAAVAEAESRQDAEVGPRTPSRRTLLETCRLSDMKKPRTMAGRFCVVQVDFRIYTII